MGERERESVLVGASPSREDQVVRYCKEILSRRFLLHQLIGYLRTFLFSFFRGNIYNPVRREAIRIVSKMNSGRKTRLDYFVANEEGEGDV